MKKFWREKRARVALVSFLILVFFGATAELWSNSRPLVLDYHSEIFFPVLNEIPPARLGIANRVVLDYRALNLGEKDWAIWPFNAWDPFESNSQVQRYPSGPSRLNFLGTDDRGRDLLARLLYGFRTSLAYAGLVWIIVVLMGVSAGAKMGFFGGKIDFFGGRVIEVFHSVPLFFVLIIFSAFLEPSLFGLAFLTGALSWIGLSYYVRAEVLKNRKMPYVEAAHSAGAGPWRVLFYHVLPNSLGPVITLSPLILSTHILGLAALDFLGFGLAPPTPSWGELLNQAQKHFTTAWWLGVFPSLALFVTLALLAMIGDGVRRAREPGSRK
ncbi:ABC transporter permease subunit [Bdellovibrionota bacterium FG-2]